MKPVVAGGILRRTSPEDAAVLTNNLIRTRAEARREILAYLGPWYGQMRPHSALGCVTADGYESRLHAA